MAIGLGRMLGFYFPKNFNYPYISKSITEFWRRWHITLSSWFREYVYIPLGGNRVKRSRHFFNIFVVWFLTGFWHGANWNFIFWGLYFFVLLMIEKTFLLKHLEKSRILSHIYVIFLVMISWAIFALSDMSLLGELFVRMFSLNGGIDWIYYLRDYAVVFVLCDWHPLRCSRSQRIPSAKTASSAPCPVGDTACFGCLHGRFDLQPIFVL